MNQEYALYAWVMSWVAVVSVAGGVWVDKS